MVVLTCPSCGTVRLPVSSVHVSIRDEPFGFRVLFVCPSCRKVFCFATDPTGAAQLAEIGCPWSVDASADVDRRPLTKGDVARFVAQVRDDTRVALAVRRLALDTEV